MFNFSYRRTGVIRFVKIGRLNISFCLSKGHAMPVHAALAMRPLGAAQLATLDLAGLVCGMIAGAAIWTLIS
jgi:hypothetical protein